MVKPDLYKTTIEILYNAYRNNKIAVKNSYADAVGVMVAHALGYQIEEGTPPGQPVVKCLVWVHKGEVLPQPSLDLDGDNHGWRAAFTFIGFKKHAIIHPQYLTGNALKQIESTGYSPKEIAQILRAYQSYDFGPAEDQIYYGLANVLDELAKIHFVKDKDLLESNIQRFKTIYRERILVTHE